VLLLLHKDSLKISTASLQVDLQYNYSFDFNGEDDLKFTLGIKNAFDEEVPQVYDAANWSYDP
jgi:outer membrane receptor protein involved in Fe transport